MKVKQVIEIDYNELEDIVNKHYGLRAKDPYGNGLYSFVATEECGNDSDHSFSVPKAEPLDEYDQKKIKRLRGTGHSRYSNYAILQDLVNNGVLAPGEYLVKVCW